MSLKRSNYIKTLSLFVFTLVLLFGLASCSKLSSPYELVYVIDGDSIFVREIGDNDGDGVEAERLELRLIGIDAPEFKQDPWGPRARRFVWEFLGNSGSEVFLEFDVEKNDKYDRFLAYVYNSNGELVNEKLLEEGLADIFITKFNRKYLSRFKEAHARAKSKLVNIWDLDTGLEESPYQFRKRMKSLKGKHIESVYGKRAHS